MHRSLTGPVWALLMAVPLGLGVVPGAPTSGSQETQAVVRLQQEVSALRYRLDFEAHLPPAANTQQMASSSRHRFSMLLLE